MRTTQKREVCIFLPNKQHLDCSVRVTSRGREVSDGVLRQLGVSELQVFGLAVLRDNEHLFIDLERKLSKYFGKRWKRGSQKDPFVLFLRVQYYVESGILILSSKVQQFYYMELRQKVLQSQSRHQEALFFQLAACALQADVGDLEQRDGSEEEEEEEEEEEGGENKRPERKCRHYFLPEDYFPSWLMKRRGRDYLLQHSPAVHAELRGVPRSQAMLRFIKEAGRLQDGPVTLYRMRQEKKELRSSVLFGVTLKGLHVYQEVEGRRSLLYDFSWTDIDRFTFQGSRFEVAAVGSLCLSKLMFYTPSALHSKHVLKHLSDSHRLHINTREAVRYIQQLEDVQVNRLYKEAFICDTTRLTQRVQSNSLASSTDGCSIAVSTTAAWSHGEDDELEMCVDEPEELLVDDPAEVTWLSELLHRAFINGPSALPSSSWAAVTVEMKEVLRTRGADEGVSVD